MTATPKLGFSDTSVLTYLEQLTEKIRSRIEQKAEEIALSENAKRINSSHINRAIIALDLLHLVS